MPSWSGIPGTNDPMRGQTDYENATLARCMADDFGFLTR
nr:hypothetical protein CDS [Bradyrhizobium sp.]